MKVAQLTRLDGAPVYVNPDQVRHFHRDPKDPSHTLIDFGHESRALWVRETPEAVADLIASGIRVAGSMA
jgi:uncharacterized protein YlzI (FlbEa/FlbD family)